MKCHHFGRHEYDFVLDQTIGAKYDSQFALVLPQDAGFSPLPSSGSQLDFSIIPDYSLTFWLVLSAPNHNLYGFDAGNVFSLGGTSFDVVHVGDNQYQLSVTSAGLNSQTINLVADGQTWNFVSATFSQTWGGMKVSWVGDGDAFHSQVVPGSVDVHSNSDQITIPAPSDAAHGFIKGLRLWSRMLSNSELGKIVSQGNN